MSDVPPVAAVAKAATVLKAFTPTVRALSVRQLAGRTAIPRSTVHALCATLVQAGLLEAVPGGYQLGPTLLELGGQVIERTGLVRAAEGILPSLIRVAGAEAHLGQLAHGWVVYLDRLAGPRKAPMRNRVGQRAPAYLTGCGKAALSRLAFDEVAEMIRYTCAEERQPVPDLAAVRAELDGVRRAGFAVSRTFQEDRTSIAAPILDVNGRPVGGISVAAPSPLFSPQVFAGTRDAVLAGAERVNARLRVSG